MRFLTSAFFAACVGVSASSLGQVIYTYLPPANTLGVTPGGISQDGSAVGGSYGWQGGPPGAYRWSVSGGLIQIPIVTGHPVNSGYGISRDGVYVAGNSADIGYRWSQSGGNTAIGPFVASPTNVYNMSGDGLTCMGQTRQTSGAMRAFKWTSSGGLVLLQEPSGTFNSYARASNPNASLIIGNASVSGNDEPIIWNNGVPTSLGSLHAGAEYLTAMSDDGLTLWGYGFLNGGQEALRYRKVGLTWVNDVIGIYPGATSTIPKSCAADGSVATGECWGGTAPATGSFIWSADLGWRELQSWLVSIGFNMGSLQIRNGGGISADGTAMHGEGSIGGTYVGWVARNIPCLHKPTVTQNPAALVNGCTGGTAILTAAGGGNYTGNLQYQWLKNNVAINNGASGNGSTYSGVTSGSLSISNCGPLDNGVYTCRISNPCGSVTTTSSQLLVYDSVAVLESPAPVAACNGGSAVGSITAINATNYVWEWNNGSTWIIINNGSMFDINTGASWTASNAGTANLQLTSITFGSLTTIPLRCTVANPCRVLRPTLASVVLDGPVQLGYVNDDYYCHLNAANFSTSIVLGNPVQLNWQIFDTTLFSWVYLNDGLYVNAFTNLTATVSGATTTNLSFDISILGTSPNQLLFRCAGPNTCNMYFSPAGMLTICRGDFNCDGTVDFFDYLDFVDAFSNGDGGADINGDGSIDFFDYLDYVNDYSAGCS